MLSLLGFGMVLTFMYLIMSKRLSPLVALIGIPIIFAMIGGFGSEVDDMILEGIKKIAPTGVMLMFAILYFGVMIDAGLFDPLVRGILAVVKGDPLKITLGTAALALLISLDGDGSTTYMMTVSAMLPLYRRLGMNALNMTCLAILSSGIMNLTPWGGPTARAATALNVNPAEVFLPLIPSMALACTGVLLLAVYLGLRERKRVGVLTWSNDTSAANHTAPETHEHAAIKRPHLRWVNLALTVALMAALVLGILPMPVLFMVGFAIALMVNYPGLAEQRQRVVSHAGNVLAVVSLIFAAGIFTGILSNTGMVEAMSRSFLAAIPDSFGPYLATITALASMPFTFFMSNDAFYFGVLPILSEAAGHYGITPLEMARASLAGQPVHLLSPLVPSTYLLCGLAKVDFADHQRFTLKWAVLISFVLLGSGLMLGVFPLAG